VAAAAGYEFVEGAIGDLSFVARGPSLESIFSAAAQALLAVTVEDPESVSRSVRRSLTLEEPDLELLLMRFLNELVYLRDAKSLLLHPVQLRVVQGESTRLEASLAGERIDPQRHALASEVKAATAHGLRVTPTAGGWKATVTLDV
jgi:SHS2 domain-containing protein